ncbi:unnamed protein product, partial [Scytosiphon promiscuus]
RKRCLHDSCAKGPSFNVEGSKMAAYCKQHADQGMVNVSSKRCSHSLCTRQPTWGLLIDSAAKGDILGSPVINFKQRCKAKDCMSVSRWGLNGLQPTHCRNHGPLEVGLVCTVGRARCNKSSINPSYG